MDAAVYDEVHEYWFGPLAATDSFPADRFPIWFGGGEAVDQDITARFGAALSAFAAGDRAEPATPMQIVGRIVLLDQFSRNIHRGKPETYALDPLARRYADEAIADGLERFKVVERPFVILPLGHSEELADQDRAVALIQADVLPYAPEGNRFYEGGRIQSVKYRDIIARFGRFPHRNAVLGRDSTAEETAFMATAKMSPF